MIEPIYENQCVKLYQGDCLQVMPELNTKFDCCITDPPYGIVKGLKIDYWDNATVSWDVALNPQDIFKYLSNLMRQNSKIVLFSQEPYTSNLIISKSHNIKFCQKAVFIKSSHANPLCSKKALVQRFEDICIFQKVEGNDNMVLRDYFKSIMDYVKISKVEIYKRMGNQNADHVFRTDSSQFTLCTEETYKRLIDLFHIDQMPGYMLYSELKDLNKIPLPTFNLWDNGKSKCNIFQYNRDKERWHPTQKPILLIEDLVKTYTNKGDIVLDFTSGSGTTGVACMNTNRRCVLIEKEEKYCEITIKRLQDKEKEIAERLF